MINEICYNPPLIDPVPGVPPTIEVVELIGRSANWRFNQAGPDLGSEWATTEHPVGGTWEIGPGPLGFDSGGVPAIGTELNSPSRNSPQFATFYFETEVVNCVVWRFTLRQTLPGSVRAWIYIPSFWRFQMLLMSVEKKFLSNCALCKLG